MVDQPSSKPIATNPIPDLSTIAFAVEGPAYSSENETHVAYRPQSLYLVGDDGVIAAVLTPADPQYHAIRAELARLNRLTSLPDGQVLLPGFSDLHLHAPQWAQAGAALDEPLERWLGRYTFPTEARCTMTPSTAPPPSTWRTSAPNSASAASSARS